jgi:uncharacterized membrane protein YphA (DoxX/SURF4 family)
LETVIWVAQTLLAAVFATAGMMKLTQPRAKLLASGSTAWVEDFEGSQVKGIGALEVLAAIGLIVPAAFEIAPVLTPLAACGVVLLMLAAGATHTRRGELRMLPLNVVLGGLALFVAIQRFGPHSL